MTTPRPSSRIPPSSRLPGWAPPVLLGLFGVVSVAFLREFDVPGIARLDLVLLALSLSTLVTALAWFFVLSLRYSPFWTVAMLVPYVNFLAASAFARRYWADGARAPALLAIASAGAQMLVTIRLLLPTGPPLV